MVGLGKGVDGDCSLNKDLCGKLVLLLAGKKNYILQNGHQD